MTEDNNTQVAVKENPIDRTIPQDDPLYGEYIFHGKCGTCGAPTLINDTKASLVIRPQLIYTCEDRFCPGRMTDDPYWKPKTFNIGFGNDSPRIKNAAC